MPAFRKIIWCTASAATSLAIARKTRNDQTVHADTAFMRYMDIHDMAGPRYHLVNNFWTPEPQPQIVLTHTQPASFPDVIGPNVMNNNLDFNVHLLNQTQNGDEDDGPDGIDWVGPAAGAITSTLFQHGFARKVSVKEAQNRARRILDHYREEIGCPGLVVAVSIDGHVVWSEGLGYADFENKVPCHSDTVMRIASIGKALSMTIVAKLWEQGILDLDKPVQEYVPEFPTKSFEGEQATITTRLLVSHLSGIRHYSKTKKKGPEMGGSDPKKLLKEEKDSAGPNQVTLARYNEFHEPEYYIKEVYKTTRDSLTIFKDDPLLAKPGEEFLYSTHGWTLVCAVIEAVTKRKLTDCLKDLFRDLDMQYTCLDEHEPIVYNRSRNYRRDMMGRLRNAPYVDNSYKWAGGGLLSTVGDLLRFAHALLYSFQQRDGMEPGYLKPTTLQTMWTLVDKTRKDEYTENGYGMGWMVVPDRFVGNWCLKQPLVAYHTGGAIGASSVLTILPRTGKERIPPQGVVVTLMANLEQAALFKKSVEIAKIFDQVDTRQLMNC